MPLSKTDYIWFNGKLVPWDQAQVHVMAHALQYGSVVYEGIRCYDTVRGPAVFCLDGHLERFYTSARIYRLKMPYTPEEMRRAILDTIRENKIASCYIRPLAFRGLDTLRVDGRSCPTEVAIGLIKWEAYLGEEGLEQGVDVGVSSWTRMAPNTLPAMAKIGGNYINSQLIVMEAVDHGYSEAIALDASGYVSEGSGENVFIVYKGVLHTPGLANSILKGITRECVITLAKEMGYEVREEPLPRELLYYADEVFFCGTAAEITPVRSVDRIPVGAGKRGPITARLQERFFGIVSGKSEDSHHWLTPVQ
jgi:branched-chain amino acid aminotransferase